MLLCFLLGHPTTTSSSLRDAAAGIEPAVHLSRLRTLSCERYSESPSDDVVAFDYMLDDEEHSYGREAEITTWGPPTQRSGSVSKRNHKKRKLLVPCCFLKTTTSFFPKHPC